MKAYPPLPRNIFVLLAFVFYIMISSASAEPKKKEDSIEAQMKSKTLEQWFKYYVPYFNPTEAELLKQLQNDPNSSPYYHPEKFQVFQAPEMTNAQNTNVQNTPAQSVQEESSGKPKGAYMAVVIPKGMILPETPGHAKVVESQMPVSEQKDVSPEIGNMAPIPISGPMNVNGNLILPPTAEKNYAGIWAGQYNKLIEYFDQATQSWTASENSLKDVPVELNISSNGQLSYKMPEREGDATFSVRNGYISIICPDVRVRGDYEVFQKDSTLLLRTSRVLVKDKMRVSLEFKLAQKV